MSVDLGRVWQRAWRALFVLAVLVSVPLITVPMVTLFHQQPLYDFRGGLYDAGVAILHGLNPYRTGFIAHQAAIMRAGGVAIGETAAHPFSLPVYPAPANLAVLPLSLLSFAAAAAIYTAASIAAMVLAIWWLEVRDWRCYALVLISFPFVFGVMLGAMGPFLALGAAAAWRWRVRVWPPAIGVASIVVAKIFPWPLAVWLLITRRYRAFWIAVALGAGVTLGAWAVTGFAGMLQYPAMLANISYIQELRASSLVAILIALGLSPAPATALAILAGIGLLGAGWRARSRPDGDRIAFTYALVAALTAGPIVWDHYLVLLFIPIALRSPRFSGLWFLPLMNPVLVVASSLVFPYTHGVASVHPDMTLRSAAAWLILEAIVIASMHLSGEQARSLAGRVLPGRSASGARSRAVTAG